MAKKIEGRVNYMMGSYAFLPGKEQPPNGNPWKCSTLVIHDGSRERVFTEREVRAMVSEMVEGVTAGEELTLETIASKHGVSLDPA